MVMLERTQGGLWRWTSSSEEPDWKCSLPESQPTVWITKEDNEFWLLYTDSDPLGGDLPLQFESAGIHVMDGHRCSLVNNQDTRLEEIVRSLTVRARANFDVRDTLHIAIRFGNANVVRKDGQYSDGTQKVSFKKTFQPSGFSVDEENVALSGTWTIEHPFFPSMEMEMSLTKHDFDRIPNGELMPSEHPHHKIIRGPYLEREVNIERHTVSGQSWNVESALDSFSINPIAFQGTSRDDLVLVAEHRCTYHWATWTDIQQRFSEDGWNEFRNRGDARILPKTSQNTPCKGRCSAINYQGTLFGWRTNVGFGTTR